MSTDDELSALLRTALDDDAPTAPPPDRVTALRERAEAARRELSGRPALDSAAPWWERQPLVQRGLDGSPRRRAVPVRLGAAAAVLAIAVGVVVARVTDRDVDSVTGDVEYAGSMSGADDDPADAELTVTATGIGRVVVLHTDVLPILPSGDFYQVWFVGPGDSAATPNRISAGTFHPDPHGRSDVQFTAAVDPRLFPIVEITVEPGDGDPLPTGPVVLRAEISG